MNRKKNSHRTFSGLKREGTLFSGEDNVLGKKRILGLLSLWAVLKAYGQSQEHRKRF